MIFIQTPLPVVPTNSNDLTAWALGALVLLSVGAFGYLIKQIAEYQRDLKAKDSLIIKITEDLSSRNEKNAELIKEFTLVLIDHSKKLEAVADLLISANKASFDNFKMDIKATIQDYIIKGVEDEKGK